MRSRISSRSGKTPTLIPHPQASQAGIRDIAVASQRDECRDGRVLWLSIWAEHHATTQERTLHPPCVPDASCSVERVLFGKRNRGREMSESRSTYGVPKTFSRL